MKVALITPVYGPHGGTLGRQVHDLARRVADNGGEAEVLLHAPARSIDLGPLHDGLAVRAFRPRAGGTDFALSRELWAYLEQHGSTFDVIHAHGYRALPALLASRSAGRPLVFSPHYSLVPATRLRKVTRHPYRQLARRAVASVSLATTISQAEAGALRDAVPEIAGRIRVVPAGVEADVIAAAEPLPTRRSVVLTMGPLERGRRIDRVISTLPDLGPEFELVIVGRGPEHRALQSHADDLGIAERVRFVGELNDPERYRWLRTASVVVAMAEDSVSGMELVEAVCAGAPVIASDVSAHVEAAAQLDPRAIRLLSVQSSPLALADAIIVAQRERGEPGTPAGVVTSTQAAQHTIDAYQGLLDSAEPVLGRALSA
jgi:glycosyltransferase involved in cell wall biosynthesis